MAKANEIVLECLEVAGINQTELARRMGVDRRNLNQMLHRGQDIKHDKFVEMLECIGFRVEIEDAGCYKVNPELAVRIKDSGSPKGKFWTEKDGMFIGIINSDAGTDVSDFADKMDLIDWLDGYEL